MGTVSASAVRHFEDLQSCLLCLLAPGVNDVKAIQGGDIDRGLSSEGVYVLHSAIVVDVVLMKDIDAFSA